MVKNMVLKPWKKLGSRKAADLKLFRARWDKLENPRTGQAMERLVLETPDWVNVVPVTTDGEVVLVHQYRFGIEALSVEIPGGLIDPGEDSEAAARRELAEETGFTGGDWQYLGMVEPNPAFHNNDCHHWLAWDVIKTQEPVLDAGEDILVQTVSFDRIRQMISSGELKHVLALSALSRVKAIWQKM